MTDIFDSSNFMPHGHCYLWSKEIVSLHVISDSLIVLSYYSIPILLIYFVFKKQNIPFNWLFLMFAIFIFACGTTHLMEIINVWRSEYFLSGMIKLFTGIISMTTVGAMGYLIPRVFSAKSQGIFLMSTNQLRDEITRLKNENEKLRKKL